jgi:hypothetical protein
METRNGDQNRFFPRRLHQGMPEGWDSSDATAALEMAARARQGERRSSQRAPALAPARFPERPRLGEWGAD